LPAEGKRKKTLVLGNRGQIKVHVLIEQKKIEKERDKSEKERRDN
jgi:hypothetical protein